jgi:hypothetical protein
VIGEIEELQGSFPENPEIGIHRKTGATCMAERKNLERR